MSDKSGKLLQLYIYNDIQDCLPSLVNLDYSQIMHKLVQMLTAAIQENNNTVLIERDYALNKIVNSYTHKPFEVTFVIGKSGYIVAKNLHTLTGWFPNITLLPIKRNEVNENEYVIHTRFKNKIKFALKKNVKSIAIVDDTLYSGLTVQTVLNQINPVLYPNINLFFLHALEDGLANLDYIKNVNSGLFIPGKREEDVSIIRATGLFHKGAIRRLNKAPQAFYQRKQWMERWFPKNYEEIISICRKISFLLELHKHALNNPKFDYSNFLVAYKPIIDI